MEDTQKGYKDLPEGKLYHIFVSYKDCENDRGWVRKIIDILVSTWDRICPIYEHGHVVVWIINVLGPLV